MSKYSISLNFSNKMSIDNIDHICYNFYMENNKITREFDSETAKISALDFCDYCKKFMQEITFLETLYSDEYSKNKIDITACKKYATSLVKIFCKVAVSNRIPMFDTSSYSIEDLLQNAKSHLETLEDEDILQNINKYANISNKLFELEEMLAPTVEALWKEKLSHNVSNKQYNIFAKTLYDWRVAQRYDEETIQYMNNRYGLSVSYINNNKSRFFFDKINADTHIGILYKTKKILSASHSDASTYEKINGVCPIDKFFFGSNVWRIFNENNHEIFSKSLKISPPALVLYGNKDFCAHNEVVIDRRLSKPIAVFYITKYDGKSYDDKVNEKSYAKAMKIAQKMNLPLINLESKDETLENQETK